MSEDKKVRDVIDAVTGVAKALPIYQDIAQPAAQELGKGLHTVAKTVHIVLAPVSVLVWGYDQIKEFVSTKVADRLKNVPPENIITPKPNVACPALESLRYTGHESCLSDMYANLLAAAMDKSTADGAHPAFVEIIRQLTPDEAKLISLLVSAPRLPLLNIGWVYKTITEEKSGGATIYVNFSNLGELANCEFPDLTPTYIHNICRLGLAEVPYNFAITVKGAYDHLENSPTAIVLKFGIEENPEFSYNVERKVFQVTELGKQFTKVCLLHKT